MVISFVVPPCCPSTGSVELCRKSRHSYCFTQGSPQATDGIIEDLPLGCVYSFMTHTFRKLWTKGYERFTVLKKSREENHNDLRFCLMEYRMVSPLFKSPCVTGLLWEINEFLDPLPIEFHILRFKPDTSECIIHHNLCKDWFPGPAESMASASWLNLLPTSLLSCHGFHQARNTFLSYYRIVQLSYTHQTKGSPTWRKATGCSDDFRCTHWP